MQQLKPRFHAFPIDNRHNYRQPVSAGSEVRSRKARRLSPRNIAQPPALSRRAKPARTLPPGRFQRADPAFPRRKLECNAPGACTCSHSAKRAKSAPSRPFRGCRTREERKAGAWKGASTNRADNAGPGMHAPTWPGGTRGLPGLFALGASELFYN